MLRLVRSLWFGPLSLVFACGRSDPPPPRPTQPTLSVAPALDAAGGSGATSPGPRIVAMAQIAQPWHTGSWSPASITLSDVAAGDAIVVLGAYWGDLPAGASTAPTDDRARLSRVIDQGPSIVGRSKPPVFAQIYAEIDAAPGAHTIVPPYLGGPAGDGTLYVVQIRGLTEHRVIATGQTRVKRAAIPGVSVALAGVAQPGDLVLAIGSYDNTEPRARAGFSHPPDGWRPLGVQEDAANNVPSEACYRIASEPGGSPASWTWSDPTANVAASVIAALR